MATTTPNFGWPVPTSTDLVKDGATAIEALGDGVDASLVDLKGGTTGQVLAKTTNADMDFTWVTTDDANAIQNSIVDAKGDLIGATANDTPARLAVGANATMLVANSAEATGLKWTTATDQFPWTAYTPTYATGITVGNGTVDAKYQQIGKMVNVKFQFTLGSTSAITGLPRVSLPVTASSALYTLVGTTGFGDFGVGIFPALAVQETTSRVYLGVITATGTYAQETAAVSATVPFTWTTNDSINFYLTYEAA
jgi:hypothetical protein